MLDNRNLKFFKKYSTITHFKALNERISELSYFLNLDKRFQRYSDFRAPKKGFFCWQELKGNFILGMAPKHNLWCLFVAFWGLTLITLSKIIQFQKIKAYFKQNFIEFYRKYFSCSKKVIFGVWGLRTSFGPIGAKRLTQPWVQNLGSTFHKQDLILCRMLSRIKCFT